MNLKVIYRIKGICPQLPFRTLMVTLVLLLIVPSLGTGQTNRRPSMTDSILGIRIGNRWEEVQEKMERLSTTRRSKREKENEKRAGQDDDEGGRKMAWMLRGTRFKSIALKTNDDGRVVWVTGFLRPGKEISFAELGDLARASTSTETAAIWNVATETGGYRLVAKGQHGRASVIYLLSLTGTPQH